MDTYTKRSTGLPVLTVVVSVVAALLVFFAGPASAAKSDGRSGGRSGGANADDTSVASGTAQADDHSVASGAARADNGSVSSGCAEATDDSTASGGVCEKAKKQPEQKKKPPVVTPKGGGGGGNLPTAGPAEARQVNRLAFTGSPVGPELALAVAMLLLGAALMAAGAERRPARAPSS